MKAVPILLLALLAGSAFAGCFGGKADDTFDYVPGTDYKPTGRTVSIRMWVEDHLYEIHPGLAASMWAFCAAPADPADTYSANAIEYREEGKQCSVPGPTIRVTQGDKVEVVLENPHFHPHTIHWHGQHVPMEADGVPGVTQDSVNQGDAYVYSFVAKRAGTLWYHCHVDGQFHVMMGLYGVIIVEPQDTRWEPKGIDREYTLVFSTARREHIEYVPGRDPHELHGSHGCGTSGFQDCQNPPVDVEPDVFLLNGLAYPNTMHRQDTLVRIGVGETVRLRLVNAGETFETFHTHGHDMLVTHKDGNPLPPTARYYTETLPIGPGERYDVVLTGSTDAIGAWVAHTHVEQHITNDRQSPGGMHTMIVYEEYEGDLHAHAAELPGGLKRAKPRVVPADVHRTETVVFTAAEAQANRAIDRPLFAVPVPTDLCLVDDVYVTALLSVDGASAALTGLTIEIDHELREAPVTLTLDGERRSATWSPLFDALKPGNHTMTLSGEAFEGTLHVTTVIDHFASEDAARAAGRDCPRLT